MGHPHVVDLDRQHGEPGALELGVVDRQLVRGIELDANGAEGDQGVGIEAGDRIVITAGVPLRTPGKTNMLRVARVAAPE